MTTYTVRFSLMLFSAFIMGFAMVNCVQSIKAFSKSGAIKTPGQDKTLTISDTPTTTVTAPADNKEDSGTPDIPAVKPFDPEASKTDLLAILKKTDANFKKSVPQASPIKWTVMWSTKVPGRAAIVIGEFTVNKRTLRLGGFWMTSEEGWERIPDNFEE